MDAETLAGAAAKEGRLHGAGAAPVHPLAVLVPKEDASGPRVIFDHALGIVVGVMGQYLDGRIIAGIDLDHGLERLAEIPPVDRFVGGGHVMVLGCDPRPGDILGLRGRRQHSGSQGTYRGDRAAADGALEEVVPAFLNELLQFRVFLCVHVFMMTGGVVRRVWHWVFLHRVRTVNF